MFLLVFLFGLVFGLVWFWFDFGLVWFYLVLFGLGWFALLCFALVWSGLVRWFWFGVISVRVRFWSVLVWFSEVWCGFV